MNLFANIAALLGELIAKTASGACILGYFDEEECPESLLK